MESTWPQPLLERKLILLCSGVCQEKKRRARGLTFAEAYHISTPVARVLGVSRSRSTQGPQKELPAQLDALESLDEKDLPQAIKTVQPAHGVPLRLPGADDPGPDFPPAALQAEPLPPPSSRGSASLEPGRGNATVIDEVENPVTSPSHRNRASRSLGAAVTTRTVRDPALREPMI